MLFLKMTHRDARGTIARSDARVRTRGRRFDAAAGDDGGGV
jgi:hypothetical protein